MKQKFIPLKNFHLYSDKEMIERSKSFFNFVNSRRSIRTFSSQPIPLEVIENAVKAAGTSPSGANMQPWFFAIVKDPEIKKTIRIEAEKEEKEFYTKRAPEEWLKTLEKFDTNDKKPFLEKAPYLIVVFERKFDKNAEGKTIKHYYTKESVGIATGMLITALHNSGVATLTHTPSPMSFLNHILDRPANEKSFMIIVAGIPEKTTTVPNITRKKLEEIASIY
ncbi:Nitroreductase family protein [hydrothermal vent metagenome]|uniref:Nitroreductase family protein n=1 Tax=hydrothermal vent metagenome TaxID=652676 RepID=A0A3B1CQT0_9ZZZZ